MQKLLQNKRSVERVENDTEQTSFGLLTRARLVMLILSLFVFVSCNKDDENEDAQRPEIKVLHTTPELSSGIVCEAESNIILQINMGEPVEVSVEVTDDLALGSLKFDLHHNFDCHGHRSKAKSTVWSLIEIVELSGTSQIVTRSFKSPEDVRPGNYHLGMMALDETGREAEMRFFDLVIRDPSDTLAPEVVFNSPEQGATHQSGLPLEINCTINDDSSFDTGGYELTFISEQGQEFSIARESFPEGTGNSSTISETYDIPGFVSAGTCSLRIAVTDWRNNETIKLQTFELVD